jgi:hypothetical protein
LCFASLSSNSQNLPARGIVTQAILRENPNISKTELKQQLFLKFYKDDFSPEEREKILKHFAQRSE